MFCEFPHMFQDFVCCKSQLPMCPNFLIERSNKWCPATIFWTIFYFSCETNGFKWPMCFAHLPSSSARAMGISSPTPSADAVFLLLGQAGTRDGVLGAADVAHAFMATPLRVRDVIIRLPLPISSLRGEALLMHLLRALNGLRSASLEWVRYLSGFVAKVGDDDGLKSCSLEPCLFTGMMKHGPCALLLYVDDLLVMANHESDVEAIFVLIGEHVTLKRSGRIRSSIDRGGQLKRSVCVSIPSDLDSTMKGIGLKAGMSSGGTPPDVGVHVEKENGIPLSPEARTLFRAALGRCLVVANATRP